ncbi:MAG: TRAP transporter small permease [Rhodospirillales bacterium]|nr:TRAP transporter small permease [Rhodospirillales bacterium]
MAQDENFPGTGAAATPAPQREEINLRTSLDRHVNSAGAAISWLALAAMAISVWEVIMRYVFDSPTSWVHETVVFLIACIFALGGPVALARDKHIRIRVIYDAVSPAVRRVFDVINSVVTLLFTIGISYAAYVMFWRASHNPAGNWQLERSGTSWNPPFPALTKAVILIAVALMMLQAFLHVIHAVRGSTAPGKKEGAQ